MAALAVMALAEIGVELAVVAAAIAATPLVMNVVEQTGTIVGDVATSIADAVRGSTTTVEPTTKVEPALGMTSKNILSVKQKAEIEVVMKHAQCTLVNDIKAAEGEKPRRALVASGMRNAQHRTLKLYHSGSFSGKFVVKPPKTMAEDKCGLFLHRGPDPDDSNPSDSMAFVIYETSDNDINRPRLLYLLAWRKPANGSCNRVYVQAGRLPNILKLLDNEIEPARHLPNMLKMLENESRQKLLAQIGADESYSYDPETGAEAAAKIVNVFPNGNLALLGAKFSLRGH